MYITSYYDGTAYYYLMVKSGNSITTNLLMERTTSEKNGVEVTIKNIKSFTPFKDALRNVVFFPNIYIHGDNSIESYINRVKVKKFKNFAAASIPIVDYKFLLGNVLYPYNAQYLQPNHLAFLKEISSTGIVIKFDVGEINITPNRENIIYSSDTIKKIEKRIEEAEEEIKNLVVAKVSKDYKNIIDYYNIMSNYIYYDPISNEITQGISHEYRILVKNLPITSTSITFKGKDLRDKLTPIHSILTTYLPNFIGALFNGKLYVKNLPWEVHGNTLIRSNDVLILNKEARLTEPVKQYLRGDTYDRYGVMRDLSKQEFRDYFKNNAKIQTQYQDVDDFIYDEIYDSLMEAATKIDLNTDKNFLKFKDEIAKNRINEKKCVNKKGTILYVFNRYGRKEKNYFPTLDLAINFMRKFKTGIILGDMDSRDSLLNSIASLKGYVYIKAKKDTVTYLKSLNLSCVVDSDWLLTKDPMLSIVCTIMKYFPDGVPTEITKIAEDLPGDLESEFLRLVKIGNSYLSNYQYRNLVVEINPPIDPYTEGLCLKLKNYLIKYREIKDLVNYREYDDNILYLAAVIKTKSYRVNSLAYNKFRNNKLMRILCRK